MINYIIIKEKDQNCDIYKNIIDKVMKKDKYNYLEFNTYNNKLRKIITDDTYKIYLIEINIDNIKQSIEIAKEIRANDFNSEIIFITSHELLFETVFKNVHKVYTFIYKHYKLEEKLTKELTDIINHYEQNTIFFTLDKKGDTKININDILYIYRETSERKVYVVTRNKEYPTYLNLKDIINIYGKYFNQIHRACLINPNKINMYNWNENYFVLKNGKQVFMCSKKYKNNIV